MWTRPITSNAWPRKPHRPPSPPINFIDNPPQRGEHTNDPGQPTNPEEGAGSKSAVLAAVGHIKEDDNDPKALSNQLATLQRENAVLRHGAKTVSFHEEVTWADSDHRLHIIDTILEQLQPAQALVPVTEQEKPTEEPDEAAAPDGYELVDTAGTEYSNPAYALGK